MLAVLCDTAGTNVDKFYNVFLLFIILFFSFLFLTLWAGDPHLLASEGTEALANVRPRCRQPIVGETKGKKEKKTKKVRKNL